MADLTIGEYQSLMRLDKQKDTMTTMQYVIECLKVFTSEAYHMDFAYVSAHYLLEAHLDVMRIFKDYTPQEQLRNRIVIDGVEYGINPNLSEVTTIEYAEAVTVAKEGDEELHKLMQVFFREVVKRNKNGEYTVKPYTYSEERANLFKDKMDMATVFSVQAFFLTILATYTSVTKECLNQLQARKHTLN
jgi:hypothetical protein